MKNIISALEQQINIENHYVVQKKEMLESLGHTDDFTERANPEYLAELREALAVLKAHSSTKSILKE